MWLSCSGRGRTSCMSPLPGTTNHFCFWPQHCSRIVPPSLSKWRLDPPMTSNGFKWGCAQAILSSFISGVELTTTNVSWLLLPLTLIPTSLGKASISFGSMSRQFALTLLGYLNSWLARTAVLPWKCAPVSPMEACTTCRDGSPISGIPWFSKTFIISGIPKVPKNWRSFYACPEKGWGCAVESSVLTTYIPMGLDNAVNSSRQHSNCWGLQLELRLSVVRMRNKGHYIQPSCRFSNSNMATFWLLWVLLCWPCVKDVQDWLSVACLEPAKLVQLLPFWPGYWSLTRASNWWFSRKKISQRMQLLNIWFPCSFLITFKAKWGDWLDTVSRTVRAPTLHWTYFLPTGTRSFDRSHSSLDAEVAFNRNVVSNLAPLLTGWVVLTFFLRMSGNNMGTWKRRPQLPEHRLLVWRCGLATTGKRLVVWKRAKNRNHFGRNSPSAPWPCGHAISGLPWGFIPLENPTTPDLQLCRLGMTLLETLHHACLEKSSVLLSPSCGWAYAEKEKDFLACLPPLSLKQQVSLVAKSGVLCCPAAHGFHRSPIKQWLVCGTLSWSHSMEQVGILVSSSPMRDRNEVASSLSFGMSHVLTRMQLRTLELL